MRNGIKEFHYLYHTSIVHTFTRVWTWFRQNVPLKEFLLLTMWGWFISFRISISEISSCWASLVICLKKKPNLDKNDLAVISTGRSKLHACCMYCKLNELLTPVHITYVYRILFIYINLEGRATFFFTFSTGCYWTILPHPFLWSIKYQIFWQVWWKV